MKDCKFLFVLIGMLNTYCISVAQVKCPVQINVSILKKNISTFDDLSINLKFSLVGSGDKFLLKGCLAFGPNKISNDFIKPDAIFEVQKFEKNQYIKKNIGATYHSTECYDSTGNVLFDTLSMSNSLSYKENIGEYYNFTKGKYRCRIRFTSTEMTKFKIKYLYSNWVCFNVVTKNIK